MQKEWLRNKWTWFQSCIVEDPKVSFFASTYPLMILSRTLWGPLGYKFFPVGREKASFSLPDLT